MFFIRVDQLKLELSSFWIRLTKDWELWAVFVFGGVDEGGIVQAYWLACAHQLSVIGSGLFESFFDISVIF